MSLVVGTAGHIDHGKTTLLRALTGIDADRLPEERRRGMTIDVGYAHLVLPGGDPVDLVDVPGHERLIGNMLVGAGEIDAALLVVAADDGPAAQTIEHLELLDGLGIARGLAVVTKLDAVDAPRAAEVERGLRELLALTTLAGAPVVGASARSGEGLEAVAAHLAALRDPAAGAAPGPEAGARLAIDRVFAVRGRGTVVTGTLRGGTIAVGDRIRIVPGDEELRVREVQVRGATVPFAGPGRTALLLGGVATSRLRRGAVVVPARSRGAAAPVATSRLLVSLRAVPPLAAPGRAARTAPADRDRLRIHAGTDQAEALVVRGPREAIALPDGRAVAILRLDRPIAAAMGDRFVLRRPGSGGTAAGGQVLDPLPPRGVSRRRLDPERAAGLAAAVAGVGPGAAIPVPAADGARPPGPGAPAASTASEPSATATSTAAAPADRPAPGADAPAAGRSDLDDARVGLHGALRVGAQIRLAPDLAAVLRADAATLVATPDPGAGGLPGREAAAIRAELAARARRFATLGRTDAEALATVLVAELVAGGTLVRDGTRLRPASSDGVLPDALRAAMDRLEASLDLPAPPPLAAAARAAGCPVAGIRALEAAGRIVRVEDDLAWATAAYRALGGRALAMASAGPLTPAAFRDATGTSRRYVLAILEDLDRRELLRRTPEGHRLGERTLARIRARAAADDGPGPTTERPGVERPASSASSAAAPATAGSTDAAPDDAGGVRVEPLRPSDAIVLAGGRSSRFGGDKLAVLVGDRPLLARSVAAAAAAAEQVVVVVAPGAADPDLDALESALLLRVVVARDARPHGGPVAGVAAGLAALATGGEAAVAPGRPASGPGARADRPVLLVAGDAPLLAPDVLGLLVDAVAAGARAAVLEADPPAPLPCAAARGALDAALVAIDAAAGGASLRALLDRLGPTRIPARDWRALDPEGGTLRDVDRPGDLEGLAGGAARERTTGGRGGARERDRDAAP